LNQYFEDTQAARALAAVRHRDSDAELLYIRLIDYYTVNGFTEEAWNMSEALYTRIHANVYNSETGEHISNEKKRIGVHSLSNM